MVRQIYREAALNRLASPEKLDRTIRLVGPMGWLAFAFTVAVVLGACVWAFFAEAPVKVEAQGIVLPEGGLLEIVADAEGRIETLSLQPGQNVTENEAVATFQRLDLEREIAKARADFIDAEARYLEISKFYVENEKRESQAEKERFATIRQTQSYVDRRVSLLVEKIASLQILLNKKIVVRDKMLDAELELAKARERFAELDDEGKIIALRRLERLSEQRLALIDEKLKVDQLQREVARLSDRLAQERVIRSAHSGRVLEVTVNKGDVVAAGKPLATLSPQTTGAPEIFGILYVVPAEGKRITIGMKVEIEPSTVRREEYGFAIGEVTQVSAVPATLDGMRSVLKNEKLVEQLTGAGAPFEVRVRFAEDAATASGLKWSSSKGPDAGIFPGTLLTGRIVVDYVPMVELAIPGLRNTLGALDD